MKVPESTSPPLAVRDLPGPPFVPAWPGEEPPLSGERKERAEGLQIHLARPDGTLFRHFLPLSEAAEKKAYGRFEREVKSLLWIKGGSRVITDAPAAWRERLQKEFREGERRFDSQMIGDKVFGEPITVRGLEELEDMAQKGAGTSAVGGYRKGCRIGFDLGGSDRKCAAVQDGHVVFSEEVPWDPYFQEDPSYHWEGIVDSVRRAAEHLPRIDAIGGSAAGIYINNEPRVGSLFRGIGEADFAREIRPLFKRLGDHFGGVPVEVVNDGEATALSAAQSRGLCGVLGIAMGTSMAVGYVDGNGSLTPWLNELAFVPVEYGALAPLDEWSGDRGCGVQYFSQQAVGRLLPSTGLAVDPELPLPGKLVRAQEAAAEGHEGVRLLFRTIGVYLAYAILHYTRYYHFRHLLLLGRVMSGTGGDLIRESTAAKLRELTPAFASELQFPLPSEREKRHGQAIAAASLVPDNRIASAILS